VPTLAQTGNAFLDRRDLASQGNLAGLLFIDAGRNLSLLT
jgi:hypothetical protein